LITGSRPGVYCYTIGNPRRGDSRFKGWCNMAHDYNYSGDINDVGNFLRDLASIPMTMAYGRDWKNEFGHDDLVASVLAIINEFGDSIERKGEIFIYDPQSAMRAIIGVVSAVLLWSSHHLHSADEQSTAWWVHWVHDFYYKSFVDADNSFPNEDRMTQRQGIKYLQLLEQRIINAQAKEETVLILNMSQMKDSWLSAQGGTRSSEVAAPAIDISDPDSIPSLTNGAVAELLKIDPGTVSRLVSGGILQGNGECRKALRITPRSVNQYRHSDAYKTLAESREAKATPTMPPLTEAPKQTIAGPSSPNVICDDCGVISKPNKGMCGACGSPKNKPIPINRRPISAR
jgi:hypothetical protein